MPLTQSLHAPVGTGQRFPYCLLVVVLVHIDLARNDRKCFRPKEYVLRRVFEVHRIPIPGFPPFAAENWSCSLGWSCVPAEDVESG